jgi:hypothetical protein
VVQVAFRFGTPFYPTEKNDKTSAHSGQKCSFLTATRPIFGTRVFDATSWISEDANCRKHLWCTKDPPEIIWRALSRRHIRSKRQLCVLFGRGLRFEQCNYFVVPDIAGRKMVALHSPRCLGVIPVIRHLCFSRLLLQERCRNTIVILWIRSPSVRRAYATTVVVALNFGCFKTDGVAIGFDEHALQYTLQKKPLSGIDLGMEM